MYIPPHFEEAEPDKIRSMIKSAPLGILTSHTQNGLTAHHIPMLLEGDDTLIGHVAKANDIHTLLKNGSDVLVIFRQDDAYISPNWYPSKQEHHKQVPTWNYMVAHIKGQISFHHDDKSKRAVVGKLTKYFENLTNGTEAWKMSEAPKDYMDMQLDNIVAFDIKISQILAKSKLSQNKSQEDIQSVIENLKARGQNSLAKAMEETN